MTGGKDNETPWSQPDQLAGLDPASYAGQTGVGGRL